MNRASFVRRSISDRIGFDVDQFLTGTDAVIFGGAVRDSLARMEVNDIDIAALPESREVLTDRLNEIGFKVLDNSIREEELFVFADQYEDFRLIFNLKTWVSSDISIQLISPIVTCGLSKMANFAELLEFVSGVDFSNCGVAYQPGVIHETVSGALHDIRGRKFRLIEDAPMNHIKNSSLRREKFESRGWVYYES